MWNWVRIRLGWGSDLPTTGTPGRTARRRGTAAPPRILLQVDGTPGDGQGMAGLGAVLRDGEGRVLTWGGGCAPATSSNEAEYQALLFGLRLAAQHYPGATLCCLTDSRLVVENLTGRAANRSERLRLLYAEALRLRGQFAAVEFVHVPREVNRLADALAWEALAGVALVRGIGMKRGGEQCCI